MYKITDRIVDLASRHALGTLTDQEKKELDAWISNDPERQALFNRLSDPVRLADNFRKRELVNFRRPMAEMRHRLKLNRRSAASIITIIAGSAAAVLIAFVWIFGWNSNQVSHSDIYTQEPERTQLNLESMSPGESMAYMISDSGKTQLSGSGNNTAVAMSDIRPKSEKKAPILLEVPRGGEFMVMLDDSTKVWLNSESTLTYPETFTPDSRRVKITGEAYFAVTKDLASHPFYVECDGQTVKVYGTEFNVRSYPEEGSVYTSLAKGSVSVTPNGSSSGELILTPGTQAVFNKETGTAATRHVDIEKVTGWRHGRFVFEEQTLDQIMNDLGRWYDFEFEFDDPELKEIVFMGSIPRYGDFSTAMIILEKSGGVKFHTDGAKIIISRKSKN